MAAGLTNVNMIMLMALMQMAQLLKIQHKASMGEKELQGIASKTNSVFGWPQSPKMDDQRTQAHLARKK